MTLVRVVRDMRDRTENIRIECELHVDQVGKGNVAEKGQGNAVPNESEEEPEEEQATLEEEVESVGSVIKLNQRPRTLRLQDGKQGD